jgi:hypothetical protein
VDRIPAAGPEVANTARNWNTVFKLRELAKKALEYKGAAAAGG